MATRNRDINLPAPYLRRVWLEAARVPDRDAYPFCLPFLADEFSLSFQRAGKNGRGVVSGASRELAAKDHEWLVLPGGKLLFDCALS